LPFPQILLVAKIFVARNQAAKACFDHSSQQGAILEPPPRIRKPRYVPAFACQRIDEAK
jgi:hypothetical protein